MKTRDLIKLSFLFIAFSIAFVQCKDDRSVVYPPEFVGTPYELEVPVGFPAPNIPADNPMSVEGIKLGRYLFFEKKLSGDLSMSCGSCHFQINSFSDFEKLSTGIDGFETSRHSMVLFNLAWQEFFFWDGRAQSLEEQALEPITNPVEFNTDWATVVARLEATELYPPMFKDAFGTPNITKEKVAKAIAQFERTIVSANSRFDSVIRIKTASFTASEQRGYDLFRNEDGDCFHCHGDVDTQFLLGSFGVNNQFKNNGLKEEWIGDLGRERVSGKGVDRGKMKVPTVRNAQFSAPFMHDGSIPNLDSLIEFYNFGGFKTGTSNTDPNMKAAGIGRNWSDQQKDDLKNFLKSLTDFQFLQDTSFSDPHTP